MITIRLAGVNVGIENRYDLTSHLAGWITDAAPDFTVRAEPEELAVEDAGRCLSPAYLESICVYRHIAERMPDFDAFVCHGAAVAMDGKAYLFTAPSGTGKTTHARYWLRRYAPRAWILNGDKPILRRTPEGFLVCGTPWRGKEKYGVNETVPLRALCLLRRGQENEIAPAEPAEMLRFLSKQVFFPREPEHMERMLTMLDELCRTVPAWTLRCRRDPSAAELAYGTMGPGTEDNTKI